MLLSGELSGLWNRIFTNTLDRIQKINYNEINFHNLAERFYAVISIALGMWKKI